MGSSRNVCSIYASFYTVYAKSIFSIVICHLLTEKSPGTAIQCLDFSQNLNAALYAAHILLIHRIQQTDAGCCSKNLAAGSPNGRPCIATLIGIDQEIRLEQDLMIQTVYICIGVVMGHDPRNAFYVCRINRQRRKKFLHQRRTLPLLMFSIGVAILLAAQWAGNVVNNGRKLQKFLRILN